MAQEEHTSKCNNTSSSVGGGGASSHRTSKKLKHKKVPQRGMGVAQLEKIISEQQSKKDVLTPNSIISPSNSCANLSSVQKIPNFRQPPPLPPNHHALASKSDVNPLSASKTASGNWCRLLSDGEFEGEKHSQNLNHVLDHTRYTNLGGLSYESSPSIWPPPPNLMKHFQQPSSSSSMVNVSTGTSSSSVMHFQIEPPSNQSYRGNNFQPLWPEEDKMVGMKRPYPFSLENVPIPSFHCKFPSTFVSPISRSDEPASCSSGGTTSVDSTHHAFRENPSSFGVVSDTKANNLVDENQGLTGDFLKLAPPQVSQLQSSLKEKLHPSLCIGEQPQFEILPSHNGQSKDSTHVFGRVGSNRQQFISFFPDAKTPMGQSGSTNGDAGGGVDLNLKL